MANTALVTTNFWPVASETFTDNLSASIVAGAATVPIVSLVEYNDGDIVVLTIEPGTANQATFIGVKNGVQVINCIWTEGNIAVGHSLGVTIVDYDSATHYDVVTKGIRNFANNDGTLKTTAVQAALSLGSTALNGWVVLGFAPSTVVALGNRNYSLVFNGQDLTSTISPGMRLRTARTVAAPTQCTLLNGTSQYYSKAAPTGMTFTDDFTVSAWIKLTNYPAVNGTIASRYNGTSGWEFYIDSGGAVQLVGRNAGVGNYSVLVSYQSVPLNKWVHVAAQLDMSAFTATPTTSYVMIDGVDVASRVARSGTNPTALIQAGNFEIGTSNTTGFLPGKVAQFAVYNAKVTQATMLFSMHQSLLGTETSLISAISFNNTLNDLNTTNANNVVANGGAVATNADSPYGGQADSTISNTLDYVIVEKAVFSTNTTLTVRASDLNTIPTSGGISVVLYSSNANPYGMPGDISSVVGRKLVYIPVYGTQSTSSAAIVQFNPVTNYSFTVPSNVYNLKFCLFNTSLSSGAANVMVFQFYNGSVSVAANSLVQINNQNGNGYASITSLVPVVPGEVINLNVGWLTTAGTATWSAGTARQSPAIWVETA